MPVKPNNQIKIPGNATTLSDISLPDGWQWDNPNLSINNLTSATAIYVGENMNNYKNTTIQISLQKENHIEPKPDNPNDNKNNTGATILNKTDIILTIILFSFIGLVLISSATLLIIKIKKKNRHRKKISK